MNQQSAYWLRHTRAKLSLLLPLWIGSALALFLNGGPRAGDTNDEILTKVMPPRVVQLLSSHQRQDVATAVRLIYMPPEPTELAKILAMLNAITKTDNAAQAQIATMRIDAAHWAELGDKKPADLGQYHALNGQKNTLPVVLQMAGIENSAKAFDPLIKISNSVAGTDFGRQALKIRESFVEFGTAEQSKANQGDETARDALVILNSQTSQEAVMRLNGTYEAYKKQKSDMLNAIGIAMVLGAMSAPPGPTCESHFVEASKNDTSATDPTGSGFYQKMVTTCK